MFYLKYRPRKFSELVGLEVVSKALQSAVAHGSFGHAYLFSGPRGTGKTTTARLLAKALNCLAPVEGEPCDVCEICIDVNRGRFLDLVEMDAASNRGIDDIRELREKVRLAPVKGQYRIYIIDEAHMLTTEAFNALLKTLEEPPAHTIFILCTTEPRKILETVKSRCQRFQFSRAGEGALLKKLGSICREEGYELAPDELGKIARASAGGFRDAETILEQVIAGGVSVDEVLQTSSEENFQQFVALLISGSTTGALEVVNNVFEAGVDLGIWTTGLLRYLRALLLAKLEVLPNGAAEEPAAQARLVAQASKVSKVWLGKTTRRFLEANQQLRWSVIPQLPLELAVVALSELDRSDRPSGPDEGNLSMVQERWSEVLEAVRPLNHSMEAVLRSARPKSFDGQRLIVNTSYKFHQERLSVPTNLRLLEEAVSRVLDCPVTVRCILDLDESAEGEEDTNHAPQPVTSPLETFNGEL